MKQRGGRVEAIYAGLRLAILEQVLEPGTKLPEDTIGEQFGASRTVVRRALELLASEELIEFRLNRGAAVCKPTLEEARDLFSVRQEIEQLVVRRLCGRLTRAQLKRLHAQIDLEDAAHKNGHNAYIRHAAEFHLALAEMTGSQLLARYMRQLVGRSALVLGLYGRPRWTDCSVQEHRDLVASLADGNIALVEKLMHHHLEAVLTRAIETAGKDKTGGLRDLLAPYAEAAKAT
ncbi:GntR family transcriptional regulator [Bradyrhizobium sp. ARR65]|uniref:GntR family transcriptional regulator n=1 Tax=Bradyrhizobium sp. ARR65 TaxID=1040989 RepID=UPI0004630E03|nr:GntR family transcriptional regulator [Bradyrhizobium sp. ARR65]